MPCVFIIVPIYNVAPYLRECLDSLIHQTYQNLRIVLINDGSTDESESIAKEYLRDLRVKLISQIHKGVGCSKNAGLKEAYLQGKDEDYVVFVDSDDYLEYDYIEKMLLSFQRHSQAVISFGRYESFNEREVVTISKDHDEALSLSGLQYLSSISNHYFCFGGGGVYFDALLA